MKKSNFKSYLLYKVSDRSNLFVQLSAHQTLHVFEDKTNYIVMYKAVQCCDDLGFVKLCNTAIMCLY